MYKSERDWPLWVQYVCTTIYGLALAAILFFSF